MKDMKNHTRARLIAMITRNEMEFIDRLGKDALFSTGRKLSRTDVISAILDVMSRFPLTGRGIHSKEELYRELIKSIEKKANARIERGE